MRRTSCSLGMGGLSGFCSCFYDSLQTGETTSFAEFLLAYLICPILSRLRHDENGLESVTVDQVPSHNIATSHGKSKPRTPIIVQEKVDKIAGNVKEEFVTILK